MVDDPDSVPDDSALPSAPVKKPLLASEALMEDLAPEEPWRAGARWWAVAAGLLLLATAGLVLLTSPSTSIRALAPALSTGGAALLCALLPLPYLWRGLVMLAIACVTVGLAFAEMGPATTLNQTLGAWWGLHITAAVTLPAALLFRERYRALPRARYLLGLAVVLSLGFVGHCALAIGTGGLAEQITSGVAIAAVVLSLLGFMGSQAPIAGSLLAGLVLAAVSAQLATFLFTSEALPTSAAIGAAVAVLAFLASALLGAVGLAMILAAASFDYARSIDFRRGMKERPPLPSLTSDSWSGRR